MPLFSIIIVSLNGEKVLPKCINAIYKTDHNDYEVILVDNGSKDNTSEIVRNLQKDVKIIRSEINLGFAGGNNLGIKAAKGNWIILLNDDTEVHPNWLKALEEASAGFPEAGILGCKLLYPDGKTIQHAGGWVEPNGLTHHFGYEEQDKGQYDEIKECEYVTGAAFAVNRKLLNKIGVLDAKYFPIYFEEIDYCFRAKKAGFQVLYIPKSVVVHHESRTTTKFSSGFLFKYHKNRLRFLLKNKSFFQLIKSAKHEIKWLVKNRPKDVYIPLLKSYLAISLQIPSIFFSKLF